jgi:hypothetical protein
MKRRLADPRAGTKSVEMRIVYSGKWNSNSPASSKALYRLSYRDINISEYILMSFRVKSALTAQPTDERQAVVSAYWMLVL